MANIKKNTENKKIILFIKKEKVKLTDEEIIKRFPIFIERECCIIETIKNDFDNNEIECLLKTFNPTHVIFVLNNKNNTKIKQLKKFESLVNIKQLAFITYPNKKHPTYMDFITL